MSNSKRFYQYNGPSGKLWGYRREYNGKPLRRKGFSTKAQAETHLRTAMSDIDALERGEVRIKPTTMRDALDLFKRKLDLRSKEKSYAYGVSAKSTITRLQEFIDSLWP